MNDLLQQYGGYGIAVVLAGYIMYLHREHKRERQEGKNERKELVETIGELWDKAEERQQHTTEAINNNTSILSSLKTLFEMEVRRRNDRS